MGALSRSLLAGAWQVAGTQQVFAERLSNYYLVRTTIPTVQMKKPKSEEMKRLPMIPEPARVQVGPSPSLLGMPDTEVWRGPPYMAPADLPGPWRPRHAPRALLPGWALHGGPNGPAAPRSPPPRGTGS